MVVLYRGGTLGKETIGADGAIAARVCKCAYDDPNNVARCEGVCDCPTSFTVTNILNGTAFPLAMNRYGQVAGAWFPDGGGACCGCQGKHGFRWNPDGSYDDIPGFGTGTCQDLYNAYADGINDFGTVVGQSSNPTGVCFGQPINLCYGERAFVSTGGSSATPIPTPGFNASGRAINNANQVVGDEVDAANNQEGFFCDGSGCVRLTMAAFYLNNLGQILGYLPSDPSGSNGGWYLREPDGTTVALADDVFPFINDVGQLPAATGVYYSRSLCSGGSQAQRPCDPVRQGEDCPDGECVAAGTIKSLSGILGNRTTGLINSRGDMLVSDSGTGEQFLYCNGNSSLVRINVSLDYDSALNDTRHIIGGTFSGAPPLFIAPQ